MANMSTKVLPAFSIIVPVYNGELSISGCIESVLQQHHQHYELIIIDDGSKDKTQEICQQYCLLDERITYYRQDNRGVSSARNYGIEVAKNEYILFVDADDFLAINFLHYFSQLIVTGSLDVPALIIQDYVAEVHTLQGKEEPFKWGKFPCEEHSIAGAFKRLSTMNWFNWGVPFAKLYRLSILKKYAIAFDERVSFREDLMFMLDYIRHVDKLCFDSTANYHYVIDNTKPSLSSATPSFESESIFFAYAKEMASQYSNEFNLDGKVQAVLDRMIYTAFFRCINSCMYRYKVAMPKQDRIKNLRLLSTKENLRRLLDSGVIDTKAKYFAFTLLKYNLYNLYDLLNKVRFGLIS